MHESSLDRLDRQAAMAAAALARRGAMPPALAARWQQVRLAKTVAEESAYPEPADGANAYPIVFLDADPVADQGVQTITTADRQSAPAAYVANLCQGKLGYIPEDETIWVFFHRGGWWTFYAAAAGDIQWAVVQTKPSNGPGPVTVSVKALDPNAPTGSATGDAFDVVTVARPNLDTALFADYIVGWQEFDGAKTIVTDVWDDPIGTIKAWGSTEDLRDGWRELGSSAHKFLRGADSGDTLLDSGGSDTHTHDDLVHSGSLTHTSLTLCTIQAGPPDNYTVLTGTDHSLDDHTSISGDNVPACLYVKWIERYE